MGNVRRSSSVFPFFSSAQSRMVTAGKKTARIKGSMPKNGRISARPTMKNWVIKRPLAKRTKTMMKI